jgi:hypothetical protein
MTPIFKLIFSFSTVRLSILSNSNTSFLNLNIRQVAVLPAFTTENKMNLKKGLVIGAVGAIALCVGVSLISKTKSSVLVSAESRAASQDGMRTLSILPKWNEADPAKLVNVTLDNQQIVSKKPFQAADTWLRDLKFTVENVSQKSFRQVIVRLNISIDGQPLARKHEISIGKNYFAFPNPIDTNDEVLIPPGKSVEIQFNSSNPTNYQSFLSSCQRISSSLEPSQITKAEVYLSAVVFEETKTCWYNGKMMERIAENEWKVVGAKKISTNQKTLKVIKASFAPTLQYCRDFYNVVRVMCNSIGCAPQNCSVQRQVLTTFPEYYLTNYSDPCSLVIGGDCGCYHPVIEIDPFRPCI